MATKEEVMKRLSLLTALAMRRWAGGFSSLQPPGGDLVGEPRLRVAARSAPPSAPYFRICQRNYEGQVPGS